MTDFSHCFSQCAALPTICYTRYIVPLLHYALSATVAIYSEKKLSFSQKIRKTFPQMTHFFSNWTIIGWFEKKMDHFGKSFPNFLRKWQIFPIAFPSVLLFPLSATLDTLHRCCITHYLLFDTWTTYSLLAV